MMMRIVSFLLLSLFPLMAFAAGGEEGQGLLEQINSFLAALLFFDLSFGIFDVTLADGSNKDVVVPLVLILLSFGSIFYTIYYRFINVTAFRHAIDVVRGKFDREDDEGEVSHFQALTSALSATVGLGNIAGVAIAIQLGGPGATVWMMVVAFFGMTAKFHSCTLSQLYRKVNADGTISGGPMYYLDIGFQQFPGWFKTYGKILAVTYGVFIALSAIGGGSMFQVNQTVEAINNAFAVPEDYNLYLGIVIAVLVGAVILGGVKRIGQITSKLVPTMFVVYLLGGLFVIFSNLSSLGDAIVTIFSMAFTNDAAFGGFVGVLMMGVRRGCFSNEAGIGSASIVHSAAKTDEPVREGLVAMLGPFIDTILICFMTALVVVITGTWSNPEILSAGGNIGVSITMEAFRTVIPWFPIVLTLCIIMFAYSSMISWCYYGERGWIYILDHFNGSGLRSVFIYRLIFLGVILVGAVESLSAVLDFTDFVFLALVIPNFCGSIFLAPRVKRMMIEYSQKYLK